VVASICLWSVNATVAKVVVDSGGLSALRLAELRATGAGLILFAAVALLRPQSLRLSRGELGFFLVFGIAGLAFVAALHAPVWLLLAYIVVLGTIVPFILLITALHYIPATRATVVAMIEPVLAAVVAYAWLGEEIGSLQIFGGLLVLAGIVLAQRPLAPAIPHNKVHTSHITKFIRFVKNLKTIACNHPAPCDAPPHGSSFSY
jgi:drug/metabolite transporter (DMT)-like permease